MANVFDRVFYGETKSFILLNLLFYVLVGFGMARSAWSHREAKYQKALREARAQSFPGSDNHPPNRG
jgi:hypothetical protein